MINYSIDNFFNKEECDSIIEFCSKNGEQFSYNNSDVWDCKRIYDSDFKNKILNRILEIHQFENFDVKNINISMTRYYNGRYLDLHLDATSNYTIVIPLTTDYNDGRFVLSSKRNSLDSADLKLDLNLGEGVIFEGNKIYHGVMPVTNGLRCALNIWMNDGDFSYYKLDTNNKLI